MNTSAPKPFAFVLMPFDEAFDDVYKLGIKPACEDAGAYCERVDEQTYDGMILARIYNQIAKADIVISEMTGRNPNVFYETGYAHALGKRTVLLTRGAGDIPFDLKSFPHIVYEGKIAHLKQQLESRIRWFIENPGEKSSGIEFPLELYISGVLLKGSPLVCLRPSERISLELSFHNPTLRTYEFNKPIALIMGPSIRKVESKSFSGRITLPDGRFMYLMEPNRRMMPDQWGSFHLAIQPKVDTTDCEAVVRVFTEVGVMDFSVMLRIQDPTYEIE
jgi:hypothetical protein